MPQQNPDPFMSKFIKPAGSWECAVCMIENTPDATKCEACETPKPTPITKPPPKPLMTSSISKPDELMAKFTKPTGTWECSTCLVENDAEMKKCCACETARPGQTAATLPDAATAVSQKADPLMAKFMKPVGCWECDVCMIQNQPSSYKCEACQTPNPNAAPPPPGSAANVLSKFGEGVITNSNFKFGSSSDRNASCISTEAFKFGHSTSSEIGETFKFGTTSTSEKPNQSTNKTQFATSSVLKRKRDDNESADPLMAKFMKPAGCWECDVCMIQNQPSSYKCEACQTPNPNAAPPPSGSAANVLSKFGEGVITNSNFKFGSSSDRNASCTSTEAFKFGRSTSSEIAETFKFGTTSTSEKPKQSTNKTLFATSSMLKRKRDENESADPLMAKFMKPAGCWECDVCMLQNQPSSYKCEACQTPNPNAAPPPPGSAANVLSKFGEGVITNSNFKFGSSSDRSASCTSTEVFKFGHSTSSEIAETFKFGTTSTSKKPNQSTNKTLFATSSVLKRKRDDNESGQ